MRLKRKLFISLSLSSLLVAPLSMMTISCGKASPVGKTVGAAEWTLSKINKVALQNTTSYREFVNSHEIEGSVNNSSVGMLIDEMHHLAYLVRQNKIQELDFEKILPKNKHGWRDENELKELVKKMYTKDVWAMMERYNSWISVDITDTRKEFWKYVVPYSMASQVVTFDFKLLPNVNDYDSKIKAMNEKEWSPAELATLNSGNQSRIQSMFRVLSYYLEREQDIDADGLVNWTDSDIDGDGIPNYREKDEDNNGILNIYEDMDYDGIPNWDDPDIDGDGLRNWKDDDMDGDFILNRNDIDQDGDAIIDRDDELQRYDSDFVWTGTESMDAQKLTYARILTVLRHRGYRNLLIDNNWRNNVYIGSERHFPDFIDYSDDTDDGDEVVEDEDAWKPIGSIHSIDADVMYAQGRKFIDDFNDLTSYFINQEVSRLHLEPTNFNGLSKLTDNKSSVDVAFSDTTEASMAMRASTMTALGYDDSIRYVVPDNPSYSAKVVGIPNYVKDTEHIYHWLVGDGRINSNNRGHVLYGFDDKTTDGFIGRGHITYPAYASNFDYYRFTPPFSEFYKAVKNNINDAFLQYDKYSWELMNITSTDENELSEVQTRINAKNTIYSMTNLDVRSKLLDYYYKTVKPV